MALQASSKTRRSHTGRPSAFCALASFALIVTACGQRSAEQASVEGVADAAPTSVDAGAAYAAPSAKFDFRVEKNVMAPMRDGVRLATDLYIPIDAGERMPVLLTRTPYNKNRSGAADAKFYAGQGYVVAVQDVRGKYESEGVYTVSGGSRSDGYDTLTWLAAQDWSTGKIGTFGCSYLGENQYMLMAEKHPNHFAAIPEAAGGGIGSAGGLYTYFGETAGSGVTTLASGIGWFWLDGDKTKTGQPPEIDDWLAVYNHLPVVDAIKAFSDLDTDFEEYVSDLPSGAGWMDQHGYVRDEDTFTTPALHVNSWFDYGVEATVFARGFFEQNAASDVGRRQAMIISPSGHCDSEDLTRDSVIGELSVGDPRYDYYGLYLRWFDHWLRDEDNGVLSDLPKATYYMMGANEWRSSDAWPPASVKPTAYYVTGAGSNPATNVDGGLSTDAPSGAASTSFVYDPLSPTPTRGGADCCWAGITTPIFGSYDQSEILARDDVLYFETPKLEAPVAIAGGVEVELFVSSDAPDTDFIARLLSIDAEGRAFNITHKIFRARYREGMMREVQMEPGGVYKLSFRMPDTAIEFPKGGRVGVAITSSDFPRYIRNLNTMEHPALGTEVRTANNTVHHSAAYPSRLILPVLE